MQSQLNDYPNAFQQLNLAQKQRLCLYCSTHGLCKPAKDKTQRIGNGCYTGFEQSKWIWCGQWLELDWFKVVLITRSKNESK